MPSWIGNRRLWQKLYAGRTGQSVFSKAEQYDASNETIINTQYITHKLIIFLYKLMILSHWILFITIF